MTAGTALQWAWVKLLLLHKKETPTNLIPGTQDEQQHPRPDPQQPLARVQSFLAPPLTLVWPVLPFATSVWHKLSITIAPLGEQKEQFSLPL